jgi:hypothetical protein
MLTSTTKWHYPQRIICGSNMQSVTQRTICVLENRDVVAIVARNEKTLSTEQTRANG